MQFDSSFRFYFFVSHEYFYFCNTFVLAFLIDLFLFVWSKSRDAVFAIVVLLFESILSSLERVEYTRLSPSIEFEIFLYVNRGL